MRMFFGSCQDVSGNDWWDESTSPVESTRCGGMIIAPIVMVRVVIITTMDGDVISVADWETIER